MILKHCDLEGIAAGRISLVFRRWRRPTVRSGGRLRTAAGVLAIEAVDAISERDIDDDAASRAGFVDRDALLAWLKEPSAGQLYRIRVRLDGPDPRIALRERAALDAPELSELMARLSRLDAAGRYGPWTTAVLRAIAAHPEVRAVQLAQTLGYPKDWLKINVRKLKDLGLTESLPLGYRLSPRGRAILERLAPERSSSERSS